MAQILHMSDARCSRVRGFVRGDDGMIVFAMPAAVVRVDEWGCSCLLWRSAGWHHNGSMDRAMSLEMLGHCRLAVRRGVAEGFLLYGDDASANVHEVLALRVVKAGNEYWAKWGTVTRDELPREFAAMSGLRR